jgi:hypothetical protein
MSLQTCVVTELLATLFADALCPNWMFLSRSVGGMLILLISSRNLTT